MTATEREELRKSAGQNAGRDRPARATAPSEARPS